ncbi:MAG: hydrogenase maturation nickel metallochaperone HypA [Calditrichaeota bacterium]|nr:MAG: hydrogenase maturation nickel metallochaperone HypA [Calditrichota bacterium]
MHELSVALSLIELAEAEAKQAGATHIESVRVRVGALSGVVPEALQFAFEAASEGTMLEGAKLEIEELPIRIFCPHCHAEREVPAGFILRCPVCNEFCGDIRQGKELELASLTLLTEERP